MVSIRVVTWNSNGLPKSGKKVFLEGLSGDLTAVPHCGCKTRKQLADCLALPQSKVIIDERILDGYTIGAYVKLGNVERVPLTLPTGYVAFLWNISDKFQVQCLAIYSRWYPKPNGSNKGWVKDTWETLSICSEWLKSGPSVILGDLNATCFYDQPGAINRGQYRWIENNNEVDCTRIVELLKSLGLRSSWHEHNKQLPGFERQHTYARAKTHIDYIFVSREISIICSKIVERSSDHSAVVSDIQMNLSQEELW